VTPFPHMRLVFVKTSETLNFEKHLALKNI